MNAIRRAWAWFWGESSRYRGRHVHRWRRYNREADDRALAVHDEAEG